MRIMLITRCLDYGGAERQLVELARGLRSRGHAVLVVTFYGGPLVRVLEGAGVPVLHLSKRSRWDFVGPVRRVLDAARGFRPEVVHGYLPGPNLLALLVGRACRVRVVFGVRSSKVVLVDEPRAERLVLRLETIALRMADRVVVNSWCGRETLLRRGCPGDRLSVIHNGIDIDRFAPGPEKRALRSERSVTIGAVGRLHSQKDHATLLDAVARASAVDRRLVLRCVGDGPAVMVDDLRRKAASLGIDDRLVLEPARGEIEDVYADLDLLVSSSIGESFPNVVAEAMACGVPAVVTDVGDAAIIVGGTGMVVEAGNAEQMSQAILALVDVLERRGDDVRTATRVRVVETFSLTAMVSRTEALLRSTVGPSVTGTRSCG